MSPRRSMSVATPSTASSTSCTSRSRASNESGSAMRGGAAAPPARRFAYCTTGSGRFLDQLPTLPASLHHRVTLPDWQIDAAAVDLTRPLDVVELLAAAPA